MHLTACPGGAGGLLDAALPARALGLAWLGQAGFLVRFGRYRLLLDPYLSDHLGRKYAGTPLPHTRMMVAPIAVEAFHDLDWVFCSHRHGDHMDPVALPALARGNSRCRFVVPRAEIGSAVATGLREERLVPCNAGEVLELAPEVSVRVLASAHETLQANEGGEHHFLGFALRLGGIGLYHSGDCVVYAGLAGQLRQLRLDLALLPVNGRSRRLARQGIAGNMDFAEAAGLCLEAGIGMLVPHHFGMFAFNTADPNELQAAIAGLEKGSLGCQLPRGDEFYVISRRCPDVG